MARAFPQIPTELAAHIFSYVDAPVLLRASATSRAWRSLALGCIRRFGWLVEAWRVPSATLQSLRSLEELSAMSFAYLEWCLFDGSTYHHLRRLRHLRINPDPAFALIIIGTSNVSALRLPALETLVVTEGGFLPSNLAQVAPNLRKLIFHTKRIPLARLAGLSELRTLSIMRTRGATLDGSPVDLPALRKISIGSDYLHNPHVLSEFTTLEAIELLGQCTAMPYLENLHSLRKLTVSAGGGREASTPPPQLRARVTDLTVRSAGRITIDVSVFPRLEHLRVTAHSVTLRHESTCPLALQSLHLDVEFLTWLLPLDTLPALRILSLHVRRVNGGAVRFHLLPGRLDMLEVRYCQDRLCALSPDAWPRPPLVARVW